MNSLRGLTLGHRLWCLLYLDVLLVGKEAQVVIKLKCVWLVAPFTEGRLDDLALLDETTFFTLALHTGKGGLLHFGDDVRASDDDTPEGHKLLDVSGVELPNAVDFFEVVGSNLDHNVELLIILFGHSVRVLPKGAMLGAGLLGSGSHTNLSIQVHLSVDRCGHQIKQRNDIAREILQLSV